ncbi:MAG: hypothetical protein A2Y38_10870 [Spirochaetes bacterium GWB1_59_5]|nr:MAG: hypothetical protein A2Y38_10870 [Spirochaetes bacterium GWB1_59_5]
MSDCYSLFKRGGAQNGIYYAQFRDPTNAKRQTAISAHARTRDEAVAFCLGFIKQGKHELRDLEQRISEEKRRKFWVEKDAIDAKGDALVEYIEQALKIEPSSRPLFTMRFEVVD